MMAKQFRYNFLIATLCIVSVSTSVLTTKSLIEQLDLSSESCARLKFVSRSEWGAKEIEDEFNKLSFETRPKRVIVHQAWDGRTCLDIDSCSIRLQAIQAYHKYTKHWPDISYNFLISGDGTIYEGTGFTSIGFHTLNYNHDSLGVALIGTFQDVYPTSKMEQALVGLVHCAISSGLLENDYTLHGHRDARCTICPGEAAYSRLKQLALNFQSGPLERYSCPTTATTTTTTSLLHSFNSNSLLLKEGSRLKDLSVTNSKVTTNNLPMMVTQFMKDKRGPIDMDTALGSRQIVDTNNYQPTSFEKWQSGKLAANLTIEEANSNYKQVAPSTTSQPSRGLQVAELLAEQQQVALVQQQRGPLVGVEGASSLGQDEDSGSKQNRYKRATGENKEINKGKLEARNRSLFLSEAIVKGTDSNPLVVVNVKSTWNGQQKPVEGISVQQPSFYLLTNKSKFSKPLSVVLLTTTSNGSSSGSNERNSYQSSNSTASSTTSSGNGDGYGNGGNSLRGNLSSSNSRDSTSGSRGGSKDDVYEALLNE